MLQNYSVHAAETGRQLGRVDAAQDPRLAIVAAVAALLGPIEDAALEELPPSCVGAGADFLIYRGDLAALDACKAMCERIGIFDHENYGIEFVGFYRLVNRRLADRMLNAGRPKAA